MKTLQHSVWPGIALLVASIIISLYTYQDYGISWDEETQREIGLVSYYYMFSGDNALENYIERDHGVGFELPLVFIENAMGITDSRDIYLMRHLCV